LACLVATGNQQIRLSIWSVHQQQSLQKTCFTMVLYPKKTFFS